MSKLAPSTGILADDREILARRSGPSGRVAAITAGVAIICMVVSGLLFFATGGVSASGTPETQAMLADGARGADLVLWAGYVDLFGYLLLAPLALFLRERFRQDPLIDLYTAAALAYILIGALGAVILAAAAPILIRDYTTADLAQRTSIATTFSTLNQIVSTGFWQILEGIPGGVWLIGLGISLYQAKRRMLSLVPFVLGVFLLLLAAGRILGH